MIRARRGVPVRAWWLAALVGSVSALASAQEGDARRSPDPGSASHPGERSSPSEGPSSLRGLFPSRQERLARIERELGRELELTLRAAPGVVDARVHLSLPQPPPLVGSAPPLPGKAVAVVLHDGRQQGWDEEQVRALVAGAVQGLAPEQVQVLLREVPAAAAAPTESSDAAPETQWVTVGPLVVERGSARLLRILLGAVSGAGLLLVAVIVTLWWRLRPLVHRSDP